MESLNKLLISKGEKQKPLLSGLFKDYKLLTPKIQDLKKLTAYRELEIQTGNLPIQGPSLLEIIT